MKSIPKPKTDLLNRDPLSDEPGSHPLGTGIGAASGGLAGTAIGSLAGPVGAVVGAAVGSLVGGLAGKDMAEGVNPTIEDDYWKSNYHREPYVEPGMSYEDYGPAYRLGYETFPKHRENVDTAEKEMSEAWEKAKGRSRLDWEKARHAARASYARVASATADTVRMGV